MPVRSLEAEERDFQAHAQQPSRYVEIVVRRRRNQMDELGIAVDQGEQILFKGRAIRAIAHLDAVNQICLRGYYLFNRSGWNARIDRRIGEGDGRMLRLWRRRSAYNARRYFTRPEKAGWEPTEPGHDGLKCQHFVRRGQDRNYLLEKISFVQISPWHCRLIRLIGAIARASLV